MKIIEATVAQQNLIIASSVISVAESVGAYALKITYDEEWEGADKIVTFKNSEGKAIAVHDTGEENGVAIPWEILRCPGKVTVGVMGYIGSMQKLATTGIYDRNTFIVLPAAFGLQEAMTPTPDIYQQLLQTIELTQSKVGDLSQLNTEAKNNLVAAINEILSDGGGQGTVKSVNGVEPDEDGNVALPIPEKTSELENDLDYQNATQTAAIADTAVALHNTSDTAHADIRSTVETNANDIDSLEEKIPAQASSTNQLADKDFVNSSIQTSTAHFRGNWETWAAVPTNAADYPADDEGDHEPTSNDYLVIQDASDYPTEQNEDALEGTWRFKYSGAWATDGKTGWHPEYQVNETPLTAEQLAALNSGATAELIEKLEGSVQRVISLSQQRQTSGNVQAALIQRYANANGQTQEEVLATFKDGLVPLSDGSGNSIGTAIKLKTLTAADYNYHASGSVDDGVAIWDLADGIYRAGDNVKVYIASTVVKITGSKTIIKNAQTILVLNSSNANVESYRGDNGAIYAVEPPESDNQVLRRGNIKNTLDSLSIYEALSANQGRVLNLKIEGRIAQKNGAPDTTTVGTVGQLLEDTANGNVYVCTAADTATPEYTWVQLATGSGVETVQEAGTSEIAVMSQKAVTGLIRAIYKNNAGKDVYDDRLVAINGEFSSLPIRGVYINTTKTGNGGEDSIAIAPFHSTNYPTYLANRENIAIGLGHFMSGMCGISIGSLTTIGANYAIAIGRTARITSSAATYGVAIGNAAQVGGQSGIAIGNQSGASSAYAIAIGGLGTEGYGTGAIAIGQNALAQSECAIAIGVSAYAKTGEPVAIGNNSKSYNYGVAVGRLAVAGSSTSSSEQTAVALGNNARALYRNSVAFANAAATTKGEIACETESGGGYNETAYRKITGIHPGEQAHDAATFEQAVGFDEAVEIATTDWVELADSDPYDYAATVTLSTAFTDDSTLELYNDAPVDFATYGFAIASADVEENTVTIYSIGQPDAAKTLTINVKG